MATRSPLGYFRSDYLNLILLPTEACNFRCSYCYETFEHKRMPQSVVDGVKALIQRRAHELSELSIGWFGGEPMLAFDIIEDICAHARSVARAQGFKFSSDMTTNGYFLDERRFAQCLDCGVNSFQISLDGMGKDHDATRKLASGGGTFDRIWSNLLAMKQTDDAFSVTLRLHYTAENFLAIGHFARQLRESLDADPRFQPMFHSINRLGGANDESITPLDYDDKAALEDHLWRASGFERHSDEESYVCYAAKGNSLIVRSTGRLAKCTVALTDDCNDIGAIAANGDLLIDQDKFRRWISSTIEERWDDAGCPLGSVLAEAFEKRRAETSMAL